MAASMGMQEMDLVDIGGGFTLICPDSGTNFEEIAPKIGQLLEEYFPSPHVRVIAEPGRFISEGCLHLVCRVIGKKTTSTGHIHYYINNGVYQGFFQLKTGEEFVFQPLDDSKVRESKQSTFWGQTCDSVDWVLKDQSYPEMEVGEWIYLRDHGAYNKEIVSHFNGFDFPK